MPPTTDQEADQETGQMVDLVADQMVDLMADQMDQMAVEPVNALPGTIPEIVKRMESNSDGGLVLQGTVILKMKPWIVLIAVAVLTSQQLQKKLTNYRDDQC